MNVQSKLQKKTLKLVPGKIGVYVNMANAYVLNNQYELAEPIYLKYKDFIYRSGSQTFKVIFLEDIRTLEDAGITHPDFEKVRMLLGK